MHDSTLTGIRDRIEALASADGRYYVACARTGDRPVPAAGHRFPDRAAARTAARLTEWYRARLRRYDPQLPSYDLIVCQCPSAAADACRAGQQPWDRSETASDPAADG
ncbi:hypothetical protein BRD02_08830 [Halobacteriales archaeon QS_8_69_73]|nr:MAG: hypothetical protein BRD02_08830 [Halobacteriales archaeon QS_8_69_73]